MKCKDKFSMAPDQESGGDKVREKSHESLTSEICHLKVEDVTQQRNSILSDQITSEELKNGIKENCGKKKIQDDGIPTPDVQLYPPGQVRLEWLKVHKVGAGLANLGNTCFLNTVIQCLTYCPPLANYLLQDDHTASCKSFEFCMMCELQKHMKQAFERSGDVIKPLCIYQNLKFIADHFQFGRQEDAHEFLRFVIENLWRSSLYSHNENGKLDPASRETTIINHIFGGYNRSQVVCLRCKKKSNKYEHFMDFILDIKHNIHTLEKAVEQFVKPELLENDNAYKCPRCNAHVPAEKTFTIHRAPNVATFQLKRFDYNKSHGGKITKHVAYPEKLDLRPFMSERKGLPLVFKLNAVLVHVGQSCNSGHYYCYIRNSNGCWYLMDDARVQRASLHDVLNQQAYVLFYVRLPRQNGAQFKKNGSPPVINNRSMVKIKNVDGRSQKNSSSAGGKNSPMSLDLNLENHFHTSRKVVIPVDLPYGSSKNTNSASVTCTGSCSQNSVNNGRNQLNGTNSEFSTGVSHCHCKAFLESDLQQQNHFSNSEIFNEQLSNVLRKEKHICNGVRHSRTDSFHLSEYKHEMYENNKVPYNSSSPSSSTNFQAKFKSSLNIEHSSSNDYRNRHFDATQRNSVSYTDREEYSTAGDDYTYSNFNNHQQFSWNESGQKDYLHGKHTACNSFNNAQQNVYHDRVVESKLSSQQATNSYREVHHHREETDCRIANGEHHYHRNFHNRQSQKYLNYQYCNGNTNSHLTNGDYDIRNDDYVPNPKKIRTYEKHHEFHYRRSNNSDNNSNYNSYHADYRHQRDNEKSSRLQSVCNKNGNNRSFNCGKDFQTHRNMQNTNNMEDETWMCVGGDSGFRFPDCNCKNSFDFTFDQRRNSGNSWTRKWNNCDRFSKNYHNNEYRHSQGRRVKWKKYPVTTKRVYHSPSFLKYKYNRNGNLYHANRLHYNRHSF